MLRNGLGKASFVEGDIELVVYKSDDDDDGDGGL